MIIIELMEPDVRLCFEIPPHFLAAGYGCRRTGYPVHSAVRLSLLVVCWSGSDPANCEPLSKDLCPVLCHGWGWQ